MMRHFSREADTIELLIEAAWKGQLRQPERGAAAALALQERATKAGEPLLAAKARLCHKAISCRLGQCAEDRTDFERLGHLFAKTGDRVFQLRAKYAGLLGKIGRAHV